MSERATAVKHRQGSEENAVFLPSTAFFACSRIQMSSLIHQRWIVNEHSASDFIRFCGCAGGCAGLLRPRSGSIRTTPGTQPPGTIAIAAEKPVTKKQ